MKTYQAMPGIRTRRRMRELTVPAAADALGVTRQAWYQWERGVAMPSAAYLPALSELLGCRIEELYEGEQEGDDGDAAEQD